MDRRVPYPVHSVFAYFVFASSGSGCCRWVLLMCFDCGCSSRWAECMFVKHKIMLTFFHMSKCVIRSISLRTYKCLRGRLFCETGPFSRTQNISVETQFRINSTNVSPSISVPVQIADPRRKPPMRPRLQLCHSVVNADWRLTSSVSGLNYHRLKTI